MVDRRVVAAITPFAPPVLWWGTWAVLSFAAALAGRRAPGSPRGRVRAARGGPARVLDVLVPAHDEAESVGALVESLRRQHRPELLGTVLVVADHCRDDTAARARRAGAEVLERNRGVPGKAPAVAEGVAWLRARDSAAAGVLVVDADCVADPELLGVLAERLAGGVDAAQSAVVLTGPGGDAVRDGLRRSYALRNLVRQEGADLLGVPCLLAGTGMALSWDALEHVTYADTGVLAGAGSSPVGVDLAMWLDLVGAGGRVGFAPAAAVRTEAPSEDEELARQRVRWERGQRRNWGRALAALGRCAARGDVRGVVAVLAWTAPPTVPTAAAVTAGGTAVAAVAAVGRVPPVVLLAPAASLGLLAGSVLVGLARLEGWRAAGRAALDAPRYLAWKAGVYATTVVRGRAARPS